MTEDIKHSHTNNLLHDVRGIIDESRHTAYQAVNVALIKRNRLLGKRIAQEELQGNNRADYGTEVIKSLSKELTELYGNGFDFSSLYKYVKFYPAFPEILDSVSPKSVPLLTWTHYRTLLQVDNADARLWYLHEAAKETWSVRTLQRNISSQYYNRLLKKNKDDNPTIGIVLCADTDEDIARYSILHGNEQLFATKYKTYLPSEEELKAEIEHQKQLFYLQQAENNKQ